ncbi:hypothetical protein ACFSL4_01705 [Streptomyces caeni]|uniref:HNH endonuclease n=1 Tax=Streptomyces caeni TaxID=2307231 RepID=A0ABW4IKC5_9ACTN
MQHRSAVLDRITARSIEAPCLVKGLMPLCWVWTGGTDESGYGRIRIGNDKRDSTYRLGYAELIIPIPDGLELDHLCRRPACWNPWHLDPVTHAVNVLRDLSPAARCARATHCPRGHAFTPGNTRIDPDGSRRCRTCKRELAGWQGGVAASERTHCPQGHPYDEANTYRSKDGRRHCRACKREKKRLRDQRARLKA